MRPSMPSRSTKAPKSTMLEMMPSTTSPGCSLPRICSRTSLRSSSRTARRERTTLLRLRLSSMTRQVRTRPMYSSRFWMRRMSTSDAGRNPRTPRSRIRPPLTTSMTVPSMVPACTIDGTVIEVVKGGLILDLGVRGFLPASLVDIRRIQNLDEYMGRVLTCRVIELNRSRNNVVLSRRAVLEEERKEVREQILGKLQPGDVVEGIISNIVDFGAFVDLEGIDGLIHISELSWGHVNHPSEVLIVGQKVNVKVLDIDRDRQRVSLGLKQTQDDPWQRIVDTYNVGDELEGKVTKVVTFGAFVEILDGVEGLVHISELCLLYTSPSPRDRTRSRMPSSA